MSENIQVVVRFKPLSAKEDHSPVEVAERTIKLHTHTFAFDYVFSGSATQEDIYITIGKPIAKSVCEGVNASIIAYGPTSSGKTYTMFGKAKEGIIPRICENIFSTINKNDKVVEAVMKCTFVEIYCERVKDLLKENKTEEIKIRYHDDIGVYIQNVSEKYVSSTEDVLNLIKSGSSIRSTASTSLNSTSSRSHAILTLYISQTTLDGSVITSKLNLVDLAGSENVGKSEVQGMNLSEAQNINKSLSCLGNVIYALTDKKEHIPYRDSKLTFLLKDSLGGNSRTVLIVCASQSNICYSETLNTLKFARRAKEILNTPKVNINSSPKSLEKVNAELLLQLDEWKSKYSQLLASGKNDSSNEGVKILNEKVLMLTKQIDELKGLLEEEKRKYEKLEAKYFQQCKWNDEVCEKVINELKSKTEILNELYRYKKLFEYIMNASQDVRPLVLRDENLKGLLS